MQAIGRVMLSLIGGSHLLGSGKMEVTYQGEKKTIRSEAIDLDGLNRKYGAPATRVALHQEKLDNLDPELRSLVALCTAVSPKERPDLEYLVEEVERQVKTKQPSDYGTKKYQQNESDDALKRIARELMLNANTLPPSGPEPGSGWEPSSDLSSLPWPPPQGPAPGSASFF
ncbi:hypothetical protein F5B20DRAFT_563630 [Whalleya microplaca]|nr:hypothetical protein F5B20DRAFT_563630 [Whalleya microplaca]